MSYILDAIRKSDQQRQRGAAPTVLTAPATESAPKKSAYLIYGLLAVALIGAGMLIGWLRPWQPEPPQPMAEPIAAKPLESTKPFESAKPLEAAKQFEAAKPLDSGSRASLSALPEMPGKPLPATEPPLKKPSTAAPVATDVVTKQDLLAPVKTATSTAQPKEGNASSSAGTDVTDATQGRKVMAIAELPPSIQQEIPKMAISLHAYSSKPAERLVSINDRLLREGDNLAEGLKLEQITPDGMTFGYKGYHFHRGVR